MQYHIDNARHEQAEIDRSLREYIKPQALGVIHEFSEVIDDAWKRKNREKKIRTKTHSSTVGERFPTYNRSLSWILAAGALFTLAGSSLDVGSGFGNDSN